MLHITRRRSASLFTGYIVELVLLLAINRGGRGVGQIYFFLEMRL